MLCQYQLEWGGGGGYSDDRKNCIFLFDAYTTVLFLFLFLLYITFILGVVSPSLELWWPELPLQWARNPRNYWKYSSQNSLKFSVLKRHTKMSEKKWDKKHLQIKEIKKRILFLPLQKQFFFIFSFKIISILRRFAQGCGFALF
jgi:hypothetical protein